MKQQTGIGKTQLLVCVVAVAVLVGWVVTYRDFQDRMNMAKTNAHYLAAVKIVRDTEKSRSANGWSGIFNEASSYAPGGGPAFIVNNVGNPQTGAVGVGVDDYGAEVHIFRPAYLALSPNRAVVRARQVSFEQIKRRSY